MVDGKACRSSGCECISEQARSYIRISGAESGTVIGNLEVDKGAAPVSPVQLRSGSRYGFMRGLQVQMGVLESGLESRRCLQQAHHV